MKIMILTVTSGEGHNAISKALQNQLTDQNVDSIIVDMFKGKNWLLSTILNRGYKFLYKHFAFAYTSAYQRHKNDTPDEKDAGAFTHCVNKVKRKIFKKIEEYKPDLVFCTQSMAARIMVEMRKEYRGIPKSVAILTDYTVHMDWQKNRDVDYIITPTSDYDEILKTKGFLSEQIVNLGMPVHPKFAIELDKSEVRKKLNMDDKPTLMLMNGGWGVKNRISLIKELCKIDADFQIVAVNGQNNNVRKQINKLIKNKSLSKKIYNYGFINNVDEIMSASDMFLGKSGALSATEAINKKLPMILSFNPPGHEFDNAEYLESKHAALFIPNPKDTFCVIEKYMNNPELLQEFSSGLESLRQPDACKNIADFLVVTASKHKGELVPLAGTKAAKLYFINAKAEKKLAYKCYKKEAKLYMKLIKKQA